MSSQNNSSGSPRTTLEVEKTSVSPKKALAASKKTAGGSQRTLARSPVRGPIPHGIGLLAIDERITAWGGVPIVW